MEDEIKFKLDSSNIKEIQREEINDKITSLREKQIEETVTEIKCKIVSKFI